MNFIKTRFVSLRWPSFIVGWILVLLLALPFLTILMNLFTVKSSFVEINNFVDWHSVLTTLLLLASVGLTSLLLGSIPAYFIVHYHFKGRGFYSRALILPLAIPGYVMAVIYSGIFDFGGEWQKLKSMVMGGAWSEYSVVDIRNFAGLTIVLAFSLFPYVYISAKNIFLQRSARMEEASLSLGASRGKTFIRIVLPLALPGLLAGTGLVMMETLNDYGASAYYGVRTVTTEIFRCWNADMQHALFFSGIVMIIPFSIMLIRPLFSKKISSHTDNSTFKERKATGLILTLAQLFCAIPFLFGFIIPFGMLLKWTFANISLFTHSDFLYLILNSFQLAAIAAFCTIVIAFTINQLFAFNRYSNIPHITRAGYILPGAILAIGVLWITTFIDTTAGFTYPNTITSSVFVLIIAYIIRFISVSLDPLNAVYRAKGAGYTESALGTGASPWLISTRISLPMHAQVLVATGVLVFIDVLKELPLTLLLRPFNFETLSISVFQYAKVNESVQQAAPAALIIVLLGIVPVLILQRYLQNAKGT